MKTLFKKILSALLAVLCFGGMFAAAADAPAAEGEFRPFQTSEEYDDTGKNILSADNTQPSQPGSVMNEYVVVIPANGIVTLSEWAPAIKKGTFIAVKAMDTTPSGENLTFSLQSSGGGGFTYGLAEEQTRRIEATTDGNYRITFHAVKAVTAKIKITIGEGLPAENEQVKGASNEYVVTIPAGGSVTLKAWACSYEGNRCRSKSHGYHAERRGVHLCTPLLRGGQHRRHAHRGTVRTHDGPGFR